MRLKFPKFEYYDFDFKLGDVFFSGKVNIGVRSDGSKVFYEINNIRTISPVSSVSWKGKSYSPNLETNQKVSTKSILPSSRKSNIKNTDKSKYTRYALLYKKL